GPRWGPRAYGAGWRKLDPGDGGGRVAPLARAQGRGDDGAAAPTLEALRREPRFDVYWNALLSEAALALSTQAQQPAPRILNGPLRTRSTMPRHGYRQSQCLRLRDSRMRAAMSALATRRSPSVAATSLEFCNKAIHMRPKPSA